MIDIRPVAYVIGRLLIVLALLMLIPALVDLFGGLINAQRFLESAVITGFCGVCLELSSRNRIRAVMTVRQAYLLTAAIWTILPLFGALPFWWGEPHLRFFHAYFEAVSGITTTGATVIHGLDDLPLGMNLWRGMLNWLGGLGIAFVAMIFLPVMRVGGMQFFRTEGFDTFGKVMPRASDIAQELARVYIWLTLACIAAYLLVGMTAFDAIINALATIATGGFSPSDQSFGKYAGAGDYVGALFMVLSSLPYIRYVQLIRGDGRPLWQDRQVRGYLRWLGTAVAIVMIWEVHHSDMAWEPAFRQSLFNLTSIMSSTGFSSGTFSSWGGLTLVVAFVIGTVGACSGSSAAGLSVFRVQVALRAMRAQIAQICSPSRIVTVKYEGRRVEPDVLDGLVLFFTGYFLLLGVLTVVMSYFGVDTVSAIFAVWTSLGNVGYGIGPMVENTGTFIEFPTGALALMALAMMLGRLGLLAIMVILLPSFWRG